MILQGVALHLYVQYMFAGEAAVLEPRTKLLGEDKCVWTEDVSAEAPVIKINDVFLFAQTIPVQGIAHLLHTAGDRDVWSPEEPHPPWSVLPLLSSH